MILIVAEKASIAKTLKSILDQNRYIIVHASGHLFTINTDKLVDKEWSYERLPYLPQNNQFILTPTRKDLISSIQSAYKSHAGNITKIINFCDAAQEGELIFRYIAQYLKFPDHLIYRAWPKSLDPKSVKDAVNNAVHQNQYQHLFDSALARAHTDWKFGINMTRACTLHFKTKSIIGRIKTPILYIIYKRYINHKNHVKSYKYGINGILENQNLTIKSKIEYPNKKDALSILESLTSDTILKDKNVEEKSKSQPKPYNLNDLQIDAFKYFSLSPEQTLNIAQSLYEKQYISYPRTDSNYFTEEQKPTITAILRHSKIPDISIDNNISLFDSSKVSDHYALYPIQPFKSDDANSDEFKIYHLIALRIYAAFSKKYIYKQCSLQFINNQIEFSANINSATQLGFQSTINNYNPIQLPVNQEEENNPSFDLFQIDQAYHFSFLINEIISKPKPLHTYSSLLKILENIHNFYKEDEISLSPEQLKAIKDAKGIGTPATRSTIIKELVDKDYILENKKKLIPSTLGISLIENIKDLKLSDPTFSAELEFNLNLIRSGKQSYDQFFNQFDQTIHSYLKEISSAKIVNENSIQNKIVTLDFNCPTCGKEPVKLKFNYKCECGKINIPTNICKKNITPEIALLMLTTTTKALKLKNKSNKAFTARLKYNFNTSKVDFLFS